MSYLERKYRFKSTRREFDDINPISITLKFYVECLTNYFNNFKTTKDLEEELKREDINTVCLKELQEFRSVLPYATYEDVNSYQHYIIPNTWGEEVFVKNRH